MLATKTERRCCANYLRKRNKPTIESTMPEMRANEGFSWKKKTPASAISAAPPARIIGTAESGPPFWNSRKKKIVPTPTHKPVSTEYHTPGALDVWFQRPEIQSTPRYARIVNA